MKRATNLISQITDINNLYLAFYKASKGKRERQEVKDYAKNLHKNILQLQKEIEQGKVIVGNYYTFTITDPKKRKISAAAFSERVLHHALMNICHPYFERHLIFDTYATRINKGTYKALEKAKRAMRNYSYVAKLDVRKYFDSIDQQVLKQKLATLFKEKKLLQIFDNIIDSYYSQDKKGIPIGNLTSQYFANFYLSALDHYIKETLGVPVYLRYMDDMLLFANDKQILKNYLHCVETICTSSLLLTLKPIIIHKTSQGVSFLGYKLFPNRILLNQSSKKRFKHKIKQGEYNLQQTIWNEKTYQEHIVPLFAFAKHAYTKRLRKEIIEGSNRVNRGGSWNNSASNCRVANRNNNSPGNRNNNIGLRLSLAQIKMLDDRIEQMVFSCSFMGQKRAISYRQEQVLVAPLESGAKALV